jgi:hypothetical protein
MKKYRKSGQTNLSAFNSSVNKINPLIFIGICLKITLIIYFFVPSPGRMFLLFCGSIFQPALSRAIKYQKIALAKQPGFAHKEV